MKINKHVLTKRAIIARYSHEALKFFKKRLEKLFALVCAPWLFFNLSYEYQDSLTPTCL